jgi:hypothetical protein
MTANAMAQDRQRCMDAGMNDARPLSASAASLEQALQQCAAPEQIEALIHEAGDRLDQLIAAMVPHLPAVVAEVAAVPLDPERFAAVCAQLQKLLAESDCASLDLAQSEAGLLRAGLGPRYEALLAAIGDFDFDHALECLPDPEQESHHLRKMESSAPDQTSTLSRSTRR